LHRIEAAIAQEGATMSAIDDRLAALTAQLADLAADVDRELADLTQALSGSLTAEQEASFQAVSDKVAAMKAAIDTADPAPVAEPAPPAE
jgi:hypothetical protein